MTEHGYGPGWAGCERCYCDYQGAPPLCDGCLMGRDVRVVEGVPYYRFSVRFRLADGRRRSWVRWSPGRPWVLDEVARELADRFGVDGVRPRSCIVEAA